MDEKLIGVIRLAVIMTAMCVALWINASHFDQTELNSIITVFVTAAFGEPILAKLRGDHGSDPQGGT